MPTAILQNLGSDGSGTIVSGGVAQTLFGGAIPPHGFILFNPDATTDLWFSMSTTAAANNNGSILLAAGGYYTSEPSMIPFAPISIFSTLTGHKFTAIQW